MYSVIKNVGRNVVGEYKHLARVTTFPEHFTIKVRWWSTTEGKKPPSEGKSEECIKDGESDDNPQGLPHMPVPPLDKTLATYLRSVTPLVTAEQLKITTGLVKEFQEKDGKKLQELLEIKAAKTSNWLRDWWANAFYLDVRLPVVVHSSPALVFPEQKFKCKAERIVYIAQVIGALMEFRQLIFDGKIPVEKSGKFELDMQQYKLIYGTCRMPVKSRDELSYNPDSKHILIIHNNHFFEVPVFGCDGCSKLSHDQYMCQIKYCIENSSTKAEPVGILSSENRDTWAAAFEKLAAGGVDVVFSYRLEGENKKSLCSIEKSLFVVCIDGYMPNCPDINRWETAGRQITHGNGINYNAGNRWNDKTLQFVFGEDGVNGVQYEHSPSEGGPIAEMVNNIYKFIDKSGDDCDAATDVEKPSELCFTLTDDIRKDIEVAGCHLQQMVDTYDLANFSFRSFGKVFVKSQKLSPDSFIQMALQLAFYRMHNLPCAQYESAFLRRFVHGRMECIRSCTIESYDFVKKMSDPFESYECKAKALREAISAHKKLAQEAVEGLGIDLHLFGLKQTAIENKLPVPELYTDIAYTKSLKHRVTTSQVAPKSDCFMCYGSTELDGYAACYNPRDNNINFGITCFKICPTVDAHTFRCAVEESLYDMQDVLCRTAVPEKKTAKPKTWDQQTTRGKKPTKKVL